MSDSTHENSSDNVTNRYLSFTLGGEEFAIPLLCVKEVIAVPEITPMPQAPGYVLGIMNLRGQVISIVDLRARLGIKPSQLSETAVIICDLHPNQIGVVVDSINSVIHPNLDQISDKPEIGAPKSNDFVSRIFRDKDRLVLMLDVAKILNSSEIQTLHGKGKTNAV